MYVVKLAQNIVTVVVKVTTVTSIEFILLLDKDQHLNRYKDL